jgi:hypothetical protein
MENNNNQKNKHSFIIDPKTLTGTFNFDSRTGKVIPAVTVNGKVNEELQLQNEFNNLIQHAEQIREYPDAFMFLPIDESDYNG